MGNKFKRVLFLVLICILFSSGQVAHFALNASSEALAADKPSSSYPVDDQTRHVLPRYGITVQQNAEAFGIDWRLIMAVMKQESSFRREAISKRGAYGLMQLMPATGVELAARFGFDNIRHPHRNIMGGTFYLAKLHDLFEGAPREDRLRLALAAYNAGPSRIYDAQELAAYLGDDPHSWESIEKALPLLSKRYYTLHESVWGGGKPRSGYFGKSRQTILYVQRVLENYEQYKLMLN